MKTTRIDKKNPMTASGRDMPNIRLSSLVKNHEKSARYDEPPYCKPPKRSRRFHPKIMSQTLEACMTPAYWLEVSHTRTGHQKALARNTTPAMNAVLSKFTHEVQRLNNTNRPNAGRGSRPCQSFTLKPIPITTAAT